jgi:hypothetical protein
VLPIWSAAADPRVVAARALLPGRGVGRLFDLIREGGRVARASCGEHLLVDRDGALLRIDIIDGTVVAGPVALHFDVPDDDRLKDRIATILAFAGRNTVARRHLRLASWLLALHAADTRAAGASLRDVADFVLGPGDWPGAGEYRKSVVRRMIATGEQMVRAGPRAILAAGGDGRR